MVDKPCNERNVWAMFSSIFSSNALYIQCHVEIIISIVFYFSEFSFILSLTLLTNFTHAWSYGSLSHPVPVPSSSPQILLFPLLSSFSMKTCCS